MTQTLPHNIATNAAGLRPSCQVVASSPNFELVDVSLVCSEDVYTDMGQVEELAI